jgi:hypothetical protein
MVPIDRARSTSLDDALKAEITGGNKHSVAMSLSMFDVLNAIALLALSGHSLSSANVRCRA